MYGFSVVIGWATDAGSACDACGPSTVLAWIRLKSLVWEACIFSPRELRPQRLADDGRFFFPIQIYSSGLARLDLAKVHEFQAFVLYYIHDHRRQHFGREARSSTRIGWRESPTFEERPAFAPTRWNELHAIPAWLLYRFSSGLYGVVSAVSAPNLARDFRITPPTLPGKTPKSPPIPHCPPSRPLHHVD